MSTVELQWHFPSTDNGDEDGINDSLREVFEGDHERYVARESIQNSIDARKDSTKPVKVRFERYDMPVAEIPGLAELGDVLERALDYYKERETGNFYPEAIELLNKPKISVLKISDYNTVGLSGNDTDTDGGWYKLIRASGVSSMRGVGGGSFGIGKGAPFAASGLRTVFYSTLNEAGGHAFQGKARISSFKDADGDVRRGMGQFGLKEGRGVSSIRDLELIPKFFRRDEQGTDIYIIGYKTQDADWTKLLLNSLLNNFWAAIHFNDLDVELAEGDNLTAVDGNNLEQLMAEYAAERGGSYNFYKAATEPTNVMNHELPRLGSVSLFVKTGAAYPKAVQLMRQPKMVVDTIHNYRVLPEPYAAVFICHGDEGNVLLRDLEPPAHDEWDPNRDKEYGPQVMKELRDWIREALRSMAEDKENEPEDIPQLSQYLPEIEERDDRNPYLGGAGKPTDRNTDIETGREVGASREQTEASAVDVRKRRVALTRGFAPGKQSEPHVGNEKTKIKQPGGGADTEKGGAIPRINTGHLRFRAREINRHGERLYQAVLTSSENEAGAIKLMTIGDDSDYPAAIKNVRDAEGNEISFQEAFIKDLKLNRTESTKLFITLKDQKRYALGVESYER